jgi:hypothetical protein
MRNGRKRGYAIRWNNIAGDRVEFFYSAIYNKKVPLIIWE